MAAYAGGEEFSGELGIVVTDLLGRDAVDAGAEVAYLVKALTEIAWASSGVAARATEFEGELNSRGQTCST